MISVAIKLTISKFKSRPKWKFESGSWDHWSKQLPPVDKHIVNSENINDSCIKFVTNITETSAICFKQSKEDVTPRYSKPWWTPRCAELVALKRAAKRQHSRHPTMSNLIAYKRSEALVKREVKVAKRTSWQKFCSEITFSTSTAAVWDKVGRLKGGFTRRTSPIITANEILTDPIRKANAIADQYEIVLNNPPPKDVNPLYMLLPLSLALCDDSLQQYNSDLTMHELTDSLSRLKNTSHGHDQVHNKHLAHLPMDYQKWLLEIFNASFHNGILPHDWKLAIIIPIVKPGKLPTSVDSYRPISLLSCISKLIEKLICSRVNYFIECSSTLSPTQGGFRKRLSTLDQIARLENTIRHSLLNKYVCIAVFFDLSKAFDTVWHTALLYKLSTCGLRGRLLRWIAAYLEQRRFRVYYEGEYSTDHNIASSVPQGAILSPTLLNVMMRDIPKVANVTYLEYADDITVYCVDADLVTATANIQLAIDRFFQWTREWGLSLNQTKTKAMMFTKKRITPISLTVNNVIIEYVQQHKFLGVVLDSPSLTWKSHINYIKETSVKRINLLKSISHHQWGSDRNTLLKLYVTLVRSRLDYGAVFNDTCCESTIKKT